MGIQQMLMSGGAGGGIADQYFAKAKYTGNGSTQFITTDLDMTGGGLTWIKADDPPNGRYHTWCYDDSKQVYLTTTDPGASQPNVTSWTSTGFNLGSDGQCNANSADYHSWNFKKAEGFFDTVTYTGDSTYRTRSHNLGAEPGLIILKKISQSGGTVFKWPVLFNVPGTYFGAGYAGYTNANHKYVESYGWNSDGAGQPGSNPTSTVFSVGAAGHYNASGCVYRAFLFAKDTENLIKCGSFTGTSSDQSVTVGFKPQFLLLKNYQSTNYTNAISDWMVIDDSMATVSTDQYKEYFEFGAVNSDLETLGSGQYVEFTDTGFTISSSHQNLRENGYDFFYMAIAAP